MNKTRLKAHPKQCLLHLIHKGVLGLREGVVPTILGTVVSASGAVLLASRYKATATGVIGFGLAHVVLGVIDLFGNRQQMAE
jgi:hypothetical protein